jgi:hypothetical protein
MSSRVDVIQLPSQKNPLALRHALRLNNKGSGLSLRLAFEIGFKLMVLDW